MPFNSREKLLAWRATPRFKTRNYEQVKKWRARPENKPKRAGQAARWRKRHPELFKEIKARHRADHLEQIRAEDAERARQKRRNDPEGQRRRMEAFRARQVLKQIELAGRPKPEVCELCGEFHLRIVFDHCHAKGNFRGWLCDRCNKVLGLIKDDPTLLRKMAEYVK